MREARRSSAGPAAVLDTLCAILRPRDQAGTDALRIAINESRLSWSGVTALADRHLLLPALWPALIEKGLAAPMPEALRSFLSGQERDSGSGTRGRNVMLVLEQSHRDNAARNRELRAQLLGAIGTLNQAGIEPGLLKGGRHLLLADPDYASARCVRDLDLLLPGDGWAEALEALRTIGYRALRGDPSRPTQDAVLGGPAGPATIDLHLSPLSPHEPVPLPGSLTAEGFWERAEARLVEGCRFRCLPAPDSLLHGILHTEVSDLNFAAGDWALRYLHQTAVASRDLADPEGWSWLDALQGSPLLRPVRAHLLAARHLFGAELPKPFVAEPEDERQYRRCRRNMTHPQSFRRASLLGHKFRQGMTAWYLRRKGLLGERDGGAALWWARIRLLASLLRRYGPKLPRLVRGGASDPLPPPRV